MHEIKQQDHEKVVLAGIKPSRLPELDFQFAWAELQGLVETAGGSIVGEVVQSRDIADPATVIGSGKLQELLAVTKETNADTVIFQTELSPAQVRNLERALPCRVIDRTQVILDIFAARARSHEGKLQVELAQLAYLFPRLTGKGAALSRLGGGIGTRGPGETQLETDRRHIRNRMAELRRQINEVGKIRKTQRRTRTRQGITQIALVGYTNAGKTSLLRAMLDAAGGMAGEIKGQNRLFDTLDPTSRKISVGLGKEAVITDTVGFIQDLPHALVDAFRSTLEETFEADLLLHVVDCSHPDYLSHMKTVNRVLTEIGAGGCPILTVYNKSDICSDTELLPDPSAVQSIRTSTVTGEGLEELMQAMRQILTADYVTMQLMLPHETGKLLARLYEEGIILDRRDQENGVLMDARVPRAWVPLFEPYQMHQHRN